MITTPSEVLQSTTVAPERLCQKCGQLFTPACPTKLAEFIHVCPACSERQAVEDGQRLAARVQAAGANRRGRWEDLCPQSNRETLPHKLPRPLLLQRVLTWQFGPRGLVLHGETGLGKTRCAWLLVKREWETGRKFRALDCTAAFNYGALFGESAAAAACWVDQLITVDLLLLDDVFKVKLTDSFEQALFAIIAKRGEWNRPIIATLNDTGDSLRERMSPDRAVPMIRRLRENCDAVAFQ